MSVDGIARALEDRFRGRLVRDFPLSRLTTYRLGGRAGLYAEPVSVTDLEALGEALRGADAGDTPALVLGRGSNLVVSDRGWPGVVVRLGPAFSRIAADEDEGVVEVGAATPLPHLANWAARRGLAGAEFAVAIPGSLGGGVRMNAGAHGREIGEVLVAARVFDLDRLELRERPAAHFEFRYRGSNLLDGQLVLDARLGLSLEEPGEVKRRMESYRRHRARTQPGAVQNAGSVFKNPPGDHAGRLVEAAGLKGFAVGGAAVSELHANFFLAHEGARAQDVYELVAQVRLRVLEMFGVELEPEIRFVGHFEPATNSSEARG